MKLIEKVEWKSIEKRKGFGYGDESSPPMNFLTLDIENKRKEGLDKTKCWAKKWWNFFEPLSTQSALQEYLQNEGHLKLTFTSTKIVSHFYINYNTRGDFVWCWWHYLPSDYFQKCLVIDNRTMGLLPLGGGHYLHTLTAAHSTWRLWYGHLL